VYVKDPRGTELVAVTQRHEHIPEGATIATDEHLRAFLRLFDGSTLTLDNSTEVVLKRIRAPRYQLSPRPNEVLIHVEQGQVAIGVAAPMDRDLQMGVRTPHADIELQEGSFSLTVDPSHSQLTVRPIRPGEATITAGNQRRRFTSGRVRALDPSTHSGSLIQGPLPPGQDLIVNGDFSSMLDRGWHEPEQQRDPNDPLGGIEIVPLGGKNVLSLRRYGAQTHGETSLTQVIDQDVHGFSSLKLAFELRVDHQSLPGGGYQSTEFPIMVELKYRDPMDNPRSRYWGFYYLDPGTGPEWRTMVNGLKVIQGEWYPFESDNLIHTMGDIRPEHVESVRVYASGWDWDTAITNISLLVQE
jgi:hypothetical protein